MTTAIHWWPILHNRYLILITDIFLLGRVKQQAYIEIAEQSFAHLHTLSLQWHLKKKMGNVVRSMDRGTDAANNLITYLFLYLVPAIAECIATVSRPKLEYKIESKMIDSDAKNGSKTEIVESSNWYS